jgi:hypothetical protein
VIVISNVEISDLPPDLAIPLPEAMRPIALAKRVTYGCTSNSTGGATAVCRKVEEHARQVNQLANDAAISMHLDCPEHRRLGIDQSGLLCGYHR